MALLLRSRPHTASGAVVTAPSSHRKWRCCYGQVLTLQVALLLRPRPHTASGAVVTAPSSHSKWRCCYGLVLTQQMELLLRPRLRIASGAVVTASSSHSKWRCCHGPVLTQQVALLSRPRPHRARIIKNVPVERLHHGMKHRKLFQQKNMRMCLHLANYLKLIISASSKLQ